MLVCGMSLHMDLSIQLKPRANKMCLRIGRSPNILQGIEVACAGAKSNDVMADNHIMQSSVCHYYDSVAMYTIYRST